MKLQSFFLVGIFLSASDHDLSYLSPHLSKWNESKLPMFMKIYIIRYNFYFILEKNDVMKFLVLP